MAASTLSIGEARRIALAAQGFAMRRPAEGAGVQHLRRALNHVGVVQIDSINVLVRSHYLALFSRVGPYPMRLLDELAYERRELFEYWGHAASFLLMDCYPLLRHRMEEAELWGEIQSFVDEEPDYIARVLDEVRRRGPLAASELEEPGQRGGPWWGWAKGKTALEWLFLKGEVAVSGRRNFERVYDLREKVIPVEVLALPVPDRRDARRELMRRAAAALGVGTVRDIADYYRVKELADATLRVGELVESGELEEVAVEGWKQAAYVHRGAKVPSEMEARALLSPFDSLVWERSRTQRLFGFDYTMEVYLPPAKRRYGYFVLPFLMGESFAARVDLKADREAGVLLVRGAHLEEGCDAAAVAGVLAGELRAMARWLELGRVSVGRRGGLADALRGVLNRSV